MPLYKNDLIKLLLIKMFEIYKNLVYDDIFGAKPYLDTIYNSRK